MKKQSNRRAPVANLDEQNLAAVNGGYDLDIEYCGTPWPRPPIVRLPEIVIGPIIVGP